MPEFNAVENTLFIPMLGRIYASEHFPKILYDEKALSLKDAVSYTHLKRESNQNWMKARVCHSLPGRLRLTATGLRYLPDEGRALAETLVRFGGMRRVRVNTAVESVLLEYDPEIGRASCRERVYVLV